MPKGIDPGLMATYRDPEMRHCISCRYFLNNINDQPCRKCLNTEPVGRARPLWTAQTKESKKGVIKNEGQRSLF